MVDCQEVRPTETGMMDSHLLSVLTTSAVSTNLVPYIRCIDLGLDLLPRRSFFFFLSLSHLIRTPDSADLELLLISYHFSVL